MVHFIVLIVQGALPDTHINTPKSKALAVSIAETAALIDKRTWNIAIDIAHHPKHVDKWYLKVKPKKKKKITKTEIIT